MVCVCMFLIDLTRHNKKIRLQELAPDKNVFWDNKKVNAATFEWITYLNKISL